MKSLLVSVDQTVLKTVGLHCLKGSQSIIVRCTVHLYRLIQTAMALKMPMTIFLALLMVLVYAAAFMYCKCTHKLKH